jgi:hypothetical protein
MLSVTLDLTQFTASLKRLESSAKSSAKFTALDIGNEIMRLSQAEVPHDKGSLQNSGTVEETADGDVVVGYHTPYAARLHEHPEYRFQKGRKGKYLEDPINRNARVLGISFGQGFEDKLKV